MEFDSGTDPAADFLAREQDQLAEIGDEIITPADQSTANGQLEETVSPSSVDDINDLISAKPAGVISPPTQSSSSEPVSQAEPMSRIEPENIRKWREEQQKRLQEKDAEEERQMAEWRTTAEQELRDWYKQHDESVEKTRTANREAEKMFASLGNKSNRSDIDWEQITRLCDFNPKCNRNTRDTSRLRGLLLQLKQNPPSVKS